ncbi:thiopeptide-type bacteriocin biosynthesis protein [Paenibacillus dendritiformis]|uniref:thiopeptide-type bacteriocin biosynthesis protein n=1 Tax=Paenibacillus dendritiformis TaxID=130049 RepID=UPI00364D7D2D
MNKGEGQREWLSLHVFYHDFSEFDKLILQMLVPVMKQVIVKQWCNSWFFIRYWEGGPHLRLRILKPHPKAKAFIEGEIARYLDNHPSPVELTKEEYYDTLGRNDLRDYVEDGDVWYPHGSVHNIPYVPEWERYGGRDGMPLSEELFRLSSEVAVSAIHATKDSMSKRNGIALDLMLLTALTITDSRETAALYLKRYASQWEDRDQPTEDWREAAERAYRQNDPHMKQHLDKLERLAAEDLSSHRSLLRLWRNGVRAIRQKYKDIRLEEIRIRFIFYSHIHMLNNRMGISPDKERYLSYLGYLLLLHPLADSGAESSFVAGGEWDYVFQERSKYFPELIDLQGPRAVDKNEETLQKGQYLRGMKSIILPPREELLPTQLPLEEALRRRRSSYKAYTGSMTFLEFASLIVHSAGTTKAFDSDDFLIPPKEGSFESLRAYPSGGARYPVKIIAYSPRIEGLEPAIYLFDAPSHSLYRMRGTEEIEAEIPFISMFSNDANLQLKHAPLILFLVGDLTYMKKVYGMRAYRLIMLECGHVAQNVTLVCTALGLETIPLAGFYDDVVNRLIGVDGMDASVQYLLPVGKR